MPSIPNSSLLKAQSSVTGVAGRAGSDVAAVSKLETVEGISIFVRLSPLTVSIQSPEDVLSRD